MNKVLILMSTYNGGKFLREQIDSLISQKLPEDYELDILVRDDGSTDATANILDEYRSLNILDWYTGDNLKPAKSFWDLVRQAPEAKYYCFCDQDDIWNDDKVSRAIAMLENEDPEQPLLYCSNVTVADAECKPLRLLNESKNVYTDFAHSLIYSLAPGCTMVFNDAARREFVKYDMDKEFEIIHDWLAHKIVAMLGKVIYDPVPSMLYRQHGNNVIGAQRSRGIVGFFNKVKRILKNSCVRSLSAKSLMTVYRSQITGDNEEILNMVALYREIPEVRKQFFHCEKFKVSKNKDFVLKILMRLRKI